MNALLVELKTRARIRLNAARKNGLPGEGEDLSLRHCLNQVARDTGFVHWEHARRVLGGLACEGEDMGSFWHAPACNALLNGWFAGGPSAIAAHRGNPGTFLLPYKRQFVVVQDHFIRELALDPADPAWAEVQGDLVGSYGKAAWLALAMCRIKAPRATFAATQVRTPQGRGDTGLPE
jgi:hypothetical protein